MNARLDPIKYGAGKDALDAIAEELAEIRRLHAQGSDLARALISLGRRVDSLATAPHIIASAIARLTIVIAISALAIVIAVVAGS